MTKQTAGATREGKKSTSQEKAKKETLNEKRLSVRRSIEDILDAKKTKRTLWSFRRIRVVAGSMS